jgi:hypothetical protein
MGLTYQNNKANEAYISKKIRALRKSQRCNLKLRPIDIYCPSLALISLNKRQYLQKYVLNKIPILGLVIRREVKIRQSSGGSLMRAGMERLKR